MSQQYVGDPIRGILHSSDASSATEIPIFNQGSNAARALQAYEYIEIHSIEVVSAAGGDTTVFLSTDTTLSTGETAVRGTVSATGGIAMSILRPVGVNGAKPYVISPAGAVDVTFTGVIRRGQSEGVRPSWRESLIPGA